MGVILKENLKLNAIAWKARAKGISYGQYSGSLSEQEKVLVYEEYAQMLLKRKEEEKARLELAHRKQTGKTKDKIEKMNE